MHVIIDFTNRKSGGNLYLLPPRHLWAIAFALLGTLAVVVYLAASLLAAYWVRSDAPIVTAIAQQEIRTANEDRNRLWRESIGIVENDIANIQARLRALYVKGSIVSEHLGIPGQEIFNIDNFPKEQQPLTCTDDDTAHSPEEQQINISTDLLTQATHLNILEAKYNLLRDQSLHNTVLNDTIPMERPLLGHNWVSSRYGYRRDPFTGRRTFHAGDDYAANRNTPVIAAATGIVVYAGRLGNYGNAIQIYHGDNISTLYGHLHKFSVKTWQYVNKGDIIGGVGSTGRSTGPHLHYEVRINNRPKSVRKTIKQLHQKRNTVS
ncbi:MAG: M23 family metallopeptidase [Proteobacteria bacterium]|nr:M23 family metallopeptidase [Pseudomonadota bacterium]MCH9758330.1 M23 family metallopeptidase [Pseudomonadota bacterium]